jgi:hypothetical protein
MQFFIEQIAICPADRGAALELLNDIGAVDWVIDTVVAEGEVFGQKSGNAAYLAFNYDLRHPDKLEFEVLNYIGGRNWMEGRAPVVSHLGMHCSAEELDKWKEFFSHRDIGIAQEVDTVQHQSEFLNDIGRTFHYCIFNTRPILGVDLKFIVRIEKGAQ